MGGYAWQRACPNSCDMIMTAQLWSFAHAKGAGCPLLCCFHRAVINDLPVFGSDGVMNDFPWMQREVADKAEIDAGENDPLPTVSGVSQVDGKILFEYGTECLDLIERHITGRNFFAGEQFQHRLAVVFTEVRDAALL